MAKRKNIMPIIALQNAVEMNIYLGYEKPLHGPSLLVLREFFVEVQECRLRCIEEPLLFLEAAQLLIHLFPQQERWLRTDRKYGLERQIASNEVTWSRRS